MSITKGVQKEVAKCVLKEVDEQWEKLYINSTFIDTLTKIPETKLKKNRISKHKKRKEKRQEQKLKIYREGHGC